MNELLLTMGNKNYSSWSLRGWFAAKLAGAPFREVPVQLVGLGRNPTSKGFSPSGYVPVLHDGTTVVWDTMAIAEYLAERHPGLWPADPVARAWARSIAAEMQAVSGESFCSSAPHSSPPGAGNWPTVLPSGTCTAVKK